MLSDLRDWAYRPTIDGTRHLVAAGHSGAAHAAFSMLETGGNAVDAGVAAGIALGVLQSDVVNFAGVAPILIYRAARDDVVSIAGLGPWPAATSAEYFRQVHRGLIPPGIRRTVVPAAPAAWIVALREFGTKSFSEVAAPALAFARDGFSMYPLLVENIAKHEAGYRRWTANAEVYLRNESLPKIGDLFVQTHLAATIQYMCDEENLAAKHGRCAGLEAAYNAFYRGDIASAIVKYHAENEGWLAATDLADFVPEIESAVHFTYKDHDIYTCPPWCQGPVLGQVLRLLETENLPALGHNSTEYVHFIVEALKIAFWDRELYYGDPRFVNVPLDRLLSKEYASSRRREILRDQARSDFDLKERPSETERAAPLDTSCVCVVDQHGNAFTVTPSDTSFESPMIPGTGIVPSMRGSQSWTEPHHPSVLAPGKRPRLTPSPALAVRRSSDGKPELMPFASPGGDVQIQAMLQVFLNVVEFGMDLQTAVECPRFASFSFPNSFQPHDFRAGQLNLESRFSSSTMEQLGAIGHGVEVWPEWTSRAGGVCLIRTHPARNLMFAGADPRRASYALGW